MACCGKIQPKSYSRLPNQIRIWHQILLLTDRAYFATNICPTKLCNKYMPEQRFCNKYLPDQRSWAKTADAWCCLGKPHIPFTLSPSVPAKIMIQFLQAYLQTQYSLLPERHTIMTNHKSRYAVCAHKKGKWRTYPWHTILSALSTCYGNTIITNTQKKMGNLSMAYNLVRLVSLSASNPLIGRRITDSPHLSW